MKKVLKKTVIGLACTAVLASTAYASGKISAQKSWLSVATNLPSVIKNIPSAASNLQGVSFKLKGIYFNNLTLTFKQNVAAKNLLTKKFTSSIISTINSADRSQCKALAATGNYAFAAACKSSNSQSVKAYGISVNGKQLVVERVQDKQENQLLSDAKNKKVVSSLR